MSRNANMVSSLERDHKSSLAAITKERWISTGVSVSQLNSGNFAIAVHDGDQRVIVELTKGELSDLLKQLTSLAG